MNSLRKDDYILTIYTISVILAFGLLFFANAEAQETPDGTVVHLGIGKSFYVPCAIALLCSLFIKRKNDSIEIALNCLIIATIISTVIHPPVSSNFLEWTSTRFIFAILCFRDIRNVNPIFFIKFLSIVSPLIILPHYILSYPFDYGEYRYGGFYGDANFFAFALNIIIAICYLSIRLTSDKRIRICAYSSIVSAIPLILLGMSRAGTFGLLLILFLIFIDAYKVNKRSLYFLLILFAVASLVLFYRLIGTLDLIESRFVEGDASSRIEGINSVINVFSFRPELIPFGIGPGNTYPMMSYYRWYGYICEYNIHNTFFSILYEMGIFAFVLYISLYINTLNRLLKLRHYLLLGLFSVSVISLSTLPGHAFMPGWILLFFLSNHRLHLAYENR